MPSATEFPRQLNRRKSLVYFHWHRKVEIVSGSLESRADDTCTQDSSEQHSKARNKIGIKLVLLQRPKECCLKLSTQSRFTAQTSQKNSFFNHYEGDFPPGKGGAILTIVRGFAVFAGRRRVFARRRSQGELRTFNCRSLRVLGRVVRHRNSGDILDTL